MPEVKGLKPALPEKYNGEDNLEVFDRWLMGLMRYFRLLRICGDELDEERVVILGDALTGTAASWYSQEVEATNRLVAEWTFEELVCALYKRFMTEVTAQKAVDHYLGIRYSKTKGALAFWNDLDQAANRMINRPDRYSMKRRFINGLPHSIVKHLFESRGISAEHSSIATILDETRQMESAIQYILHHARQDRSHSSTHVEKSGKHAEPTIAVDRNLKKWRLVKKPKYRPSNDRRHGSKGPPPRHDKPPRSSKDRPHQSGSKPTNFKSGVTCYNCGQIGHYATDPICPKAGQNKGKDRMNAVREDESDASEIEADHKEDQTMAAMADQDEEEERYDENEEIQYEFSSSSDQGYILERYEEEDSSDDENVIYGRSMVERMELAEASGRNSPVRMNAMRMAPKASNVRFEEEPYRATIKSSGVGIRPEYPKKTRQCLAAYISINGVNAYTLFDTGSTFDSISPDFVRVLGIPVNRLEKATTIQLGCAGSRSSINYGCNTTFRMLDKTSPLYFDVVNIDRYDVIVGTTFMYNNRVVLDIYNRIIYFGGHINKTLRAFSPGEEAALLEEKEQLKDKENTRYVKKTSNGKPRGRPASKVNKKKKS